MCNAIKMETEVRYLLLSLRTSPYVSLLQCMRTAEYFWSRMSVEDKIYWELVSRRVPVILISRFWLFAISLRRTCKEMTLERFEGWVPQVVEDLLDGFAPAGIQPLGDGTRCSICLNDYNEGDDDQCVLMRCWHKFHLTCLDQWFEEQNNDLLIRCPLCRTVIVRLLSRMRPNVLLRGFGPVNTSIVNFVFQ